MVQALSRAVVDFNQKTYQRLKAALELNLRRQIFVAICDDLILRDRLATQLEEECSGHPSHPARSRSRSSRRRRSYPQLVSLQLDLANPDPMGQIAQWLRQAPPPSNRQGLPLMPAFQILGIEQLSRQPASVQWLFLNYLRGIERSLPALESSLLLWVNRPWSRMIPQSAPDFWRCRTAVFDFIGEPTPFVSEPETFPMVVQRSRSSAPQQHPRSSQSASVVAAQSDVSASVKATPTTPPAVVATAVNADPVKQDEETESLEPALTTAAYEDSVTAPQDEETEILEPAPMTAVNADSVGDRQDEDTEILESAPMAAAYTGTCDDSVAALQDEETEILEPTSPAATHTDAEPIGQDEDTDILEPVPVTAAYGDSAAATQDEDTDILESTPVTAQAESIADGEDGDTESLQSAPVTAVSANTVAAGQDEAIESLKTSLPIAYNPLPPLQTPDDSPVHDSPVHDSPVHEPSAGAAPTDAQNFDEQNAAIQTSQIDDFDESYAATAPTPPANRFPLVQDHNGFHQADDNIEGVEPKKSVTASTAEATDAQLEVVDAEPNLLASSVLTPPKSTPTASQPTMTSKPWLGVELREAFQADLETDDPPAYQILQQIEQLRQQRAPLSVVAGTYRSLGNLYRDRIERGDVTPKNLLRALKAYEQVLRFIKEDSPVWSEVLNDMGNLCWLLSRCAPGPEQGLPHLQQGIHAYQLALSKISPHTHPQTYPMIQNNLGAAYGDLARYHNPVESLQKSVRAYREALRFRKADLDPMRYASTQNNLGTTYWNLAQYREPKANLKQAIAAYNESLNYYRPDTDPLNYAMIQNNLGTAYWNLAQHEQTEEWLQQAIDAYAIALQYRTMEANPVAFAATQNNLGTAYWHISSYYTDQPSTQLQFLKQAVAAYEAALHAAEVVQQGHRPVTLNFDLLATRNNLGLVQYQIANDSQFSGLDEGNTAYLDNALDQHLAALRGWQGRPDLRQNAMKCVIQTLKAIYSQKGLMGQNLALSKIPGPLLPEILPQL